MYGRESFECVNVLNGLLEAFFVCFVISRLNELQLLFSLLNDSFSFCTEVQVMQVYCVYLRLSPFLSSICLIRLK